MGKTILIVEDDKDIQDYYEVILSELSLDILKATNGQEALSIIDSGVKIDLIILDVVMPKMDGEKFLQKLRLEEKNIIPVIISSVDERTANKIQATMNVQGCFFKLAKADKLLSMVNQQLGDTS